MGRRTFEAARVRAAQWPGLGHRWMVVSRTLRPEEHPGITILSSGVAEAVAALKAQPGKDIWLMGGGVLFRSLLDAGLVDSVEVALMPVMIASGTPLLPQGRRRWLHLTASRTLPSGILMLTYAVMPEPSCA